MMSTLCRVVFGPLLLAALIVVAAVMYTLL